MKRIILSAAAIVAMVSCGSEPEAPSQGSKTGFALSFFKSANAITEKGENVVVSPYSAGVALSMLAEGAEGETRVEFDNALNGCIFKAEDLGNNDTLTVNVGDVFEYSTNEDGEINAIAMYLTDTYGSDFTIDGDKEQYVYGVVYSKTNNRVITIGDAKDAHAIPTNANFYLIDTNKSKNKVSLSSYSEIYAYKANLNEYNTVFMKYYNDDITDVVIYK